VIDETISLVRVGIALGRSTSKVQSPAAFLSFSHQAGMSSETTEAEMTGDSEAVPAFLGLLSPASFVHVVEKCLELEGARGLAQLA
jgi:hypothetical protein